MSTNPFEVSDETPVYVISVAAQLSGLHPQTLRAYDRLGLVSPGRSAGRGRRYSLRDVVLLREVQRLSQEEGVNLSGIKQILELGAELERARRLLAEMTTEMAQLRAELESTRAVAARLAGLLRNRAAMVSAVVIALLFAVATFAPRLAPYPYAKQDFLATSHGPERAHLLGTDQLGRDELSRLVYGARISMSVAVITVAIVLGIGVPIGLVSGYYGGTFDLLLMRVVDVDSYGHHLPLAGPALRPWRRRLRPPRASDAIFLAGMDAIRYRH